MWRQRVGKSSWFRIAIVLLISTAISADWGLKIPALSSQHVQISSALSMSQQAAGRPSPEKHKTCAHYF